MKQAVNYKHYLSIALIADKFLNRHGHQLQPVPIALIAYTFLKDVVKYNHNLPIALIADKFLDRHGQHLFKIPIALIAYTFMKHVIKLIDHTSPWMDMVNIIQKSNCFDCLYFCGTCIQLQS